MFQYMELSQEQLEQISKYISIADVKAYIEEHLLEYEKFLEEEKKRGQKK